MHYCSKTCQKQAWPLHKALCTHTKARRDPKLSKRALRLEPWTASTPYEVRDADFERFEKCFEKAIASFAREHMDGAHARPSRASLLFYTVLMFMIIIMITAMPFMIMS